MYICVNHTIQRCPNKIIKIFQIEDFFHLPSVSLTPVVNLELPISKKFETVLLEYSGAGGKLINEKNQKQKISRDTVPLRLSMHKRNISFQTGVCTMEAACNKRSSSVQSGVCTRGAAVFKMACAQEFQQYSKLGVYKRCSSAQVEQQSSIWSVHKRSSSTV